MGFILKVRDENGNFVGIPSIIGEKGEPGYTPVKNVDYFDGKDGYTPQKNVDYFDGKDGYTPQKNIDYFDGKDGVDGKDGYTPQKNIDYFDGEKGEKGEPGYTPVKGTDYFTEAEKSEMVSAVKAQLITEQWTFTLTDGTTVTKDVVTE